MLSKVSRRELILTALSLGSYLLLSLFLAGHHEMWRDEVRALSLVRGSNGFLSLGQGLVDEGHPILWYVLLYSAWSIWSSPLILPLASIVVAFSAAVLFFCKSPFSSWNRYLWLLGFYPLYEYSVMSRNYGLGMFFLFLYCYYRSQTNRRVWCQAVILALLANTNAFAWIVALSIVAAELCGYLLRKRWRLPGVQEVAAVGIYAAGAGLALWQMIPTQNTIVTEAGSHDSGRIVTALLASIESFGSTFNNAFVSPFPWMIPIMLVLLCLAFLRKPSLVVLLVSTVMGMELMHRLVYPAGALRHQGYLFLAVVVALWIDFISAPQWAKDNKFLNGIELFRRNLLQFGLFVLLLLQSYAGVKAAWSEVSTVWSSAPRFASFVKSRPDLKDAIISGEPDYVLETLPYYLPNKLFFAREGKVKTYVSFTTANRNNLKLSELIKATQAISDSLEQPALLLLPPSIARDSFTPRTKELLYDRSFVIDSIGLEMLREHAQLLELFDDAKSGENYGVWLLNTGPTFDKRIRLDSNS